MSNKYAGSMMIVDDQGEAVLERELSADEMIGELLQKVAEKEEAKEETAPRAKKKKRKMKKAKKTYKKREPKPEPPAEERRTPPIAPPKPGSKKEAMAKLRAEVLALHANGDGPAEIARALGIPKPNVYYHLKGAKPAPPKIEGATEVVGERQIDQPPLAMTEAEFADVREEYVTYGSLDTLKLSYKHLDLDEMRKVKSFDNYADYKADHDRRLSTGDY